MGKRLSQLNQIEQVKKEDYLLVDGQDYLESKKIPFKDINLNNFNTDGFYNKNKVDLLLEQKQNGLVSGETIKTINGLNLLGEGNITIVADADQTYNPESENAQSGKAVAEALSGIQTGEGGIIIVDQTYNPESENAQSGKAVAEGLRTKADRNKIFDYITYEINNNQVTITGCDTSISGSHIIPSTIEGYPVTIIGMNAFENCTGITDIIIPKGITSLYPSAFYGCSNLTSIEIPDTVNDMGYDVFSGCTKLKEVSFNAKITSLWGSTFANCTSLTSIVIPNGVIDIAADFYNCSSLKTIIIPDSVTIIEYYAFYNCTSLTDVYYSGTQEQWNSIDIGESNDSLSNATIHFNQKLATEEFVLNNGGSGSGTVDQIYNPESENAQSGKAVAEAIDNLATKNVNEGTLDFRKPDVRCVQLPFAEIQSIETYGIDILKEPEEDTDAVNKGYVDNLIGNINSVLATIVDGVE